MLPCPSFSNCWCLLWRFDTIRSNVSPVHFVKIFSLIFVRHSFSLLFSSVRSSIVSGLKIKINSCNQIGKKTRQLSTVNHHGLTDMYLDNWWQNVKYLLHVHLLLLCVGHFLRKAWQSHSECLDQLLQGIQCDVSNVENGQHLYILFNGLPIFTST